MSENALATATQPQYQIQPFASKDSFILAMQMAKELASSTLVPMDFRGEQGRSNCLIAIEIAGRLGISPFMTMQNMNVIHGKPSFSASFLIGMINASGRFSPLKYKFSDENGKTCIAYAEDRRTGELLEGPAVSMTMAEGEGWVSKNGSKWQTMPDLMLRYRAAAFFARTYCPEMALGLHTAEEVIDIGEEDGYSKPRPVGQPTKAEKAKKMTGDILGDNAPLVMDAELKPEAKETKEAKNPPEFPEPEEVREADTPEQKEIFPPEEPNPAPESPPLASQTECRKIWQAYCTAFAQDKSKAKDALDVVVGGKPSSAWTTLDAEALKKRLEEIKAANFTPDPMDGDAAFLAAQEEAAAFL
jgi:hypothetical protein